ncbi:MAG: hypothetical protein RLZZ428_606 [Pseudomonadota bacterium]
MKQWLTMMILSGMLMAEPFEARAVIEATDRAVLSSEIGGKVLQIPKRNGDSFQKGDLLVRIECDVFEAEREKIRTKRDTAQAKVEKNHSLQQYNSIGKFEVKISELELEEQEQALKIATLNTERCNILAPYKGRVVAKIANQFQNVKPQEELLEVVSSESLEIRAVVPANLMLWLTPGKAFTMRVDELGTSLTATITQLDPVVDPQSQTISLRAALKNPKDVIAGMSGTALFDLPIAAQKAINPKR